ncbi:hypothetical protein BT96DRAFT_945936 [Gymnopus androsaceus JB14]|uniref:HNH nuclease domain-containing protein n=1 Tax=Gymnopus androsaceus JB14 TaxID=1447944 RepID=A0A6A4GY84_9AGAR|nr:hypothetical protein BT96DRAFT_945936 [Gymnopus androsaceus JB14]
MSRQTHLQHGSSHAGPSNYVESPDLHVTSPRDNTYLPSVDVPILESEPYSSPARNIFYGEAISQDIKDEIKLLAPMMLRCIITHMLGIDVQFCHLLQRATSSAIVRILEWISGCRPFQLFVNSRFNVVCLRADIHPFVDHGGIVFLPLPDVLAALERLVIHNISCTNWDERHRYNSSKFDPLLGKATYTYRVKVLPTMAKHRVDGLLARKSPQERGALLAELLIDEDLQLVYDFTVGWLIGEGMNIPSDFINTIPPIPKGADAVDDTSPFDDYNKNEKGKGRVKRRKANTEPAPELPRVKSNPGSKMPSLAPKARSSRSMPFKLFRLEASTGTLLDQAFNIARDALTKLKNSSIKLEELRMECRTRSATASVASIPPNSNISEKSSPLSERSESPSPRERAKANQGRQCYVDNDAGAGMVADSSGHSPWGMKDADKFV